MLRVIVCFSNDGERGIKWGKIGIVFNDEVGKLAFLICKKVIKNQKDGQSKGHRAKIFGDL